MTKKIIHLNASSLKSDSACWRRWWLTVIEGYRKDGVNNDTEFGTSFHKYRSTLALTGDPLQAHAAAKQSWLRANPTIKRDKQYITLPYMLKACLQYDARYARDEFVTLDHNGKKLVELKFCIPYYVDDHVEILLEGTIDDLCKNRRGCYAIRDYKCTASGDPDEFMRSYELSTQLMFYYHAVKWYAKTYPNSIFAEFGSTNFACFIDGVFMRGKDKPVEFERSDMIFFKPERIAEFERLLQETCKRISQLVQCGTRPDRYGIINGYCFGHFKCPFFNVCAAPDERVEQFLLDRDYVQKPYEPLKIGVD